jgi:hypothetical protein
MDDFLGPKGPTCIIEYKCVECNYFTDRRSKFERHLQTKKHLSNLNKNVDNNKTEKICNSYSNYYHCECGKKYKFKQGLFKHKKICFNQEDLKQHITEDSIVKLISENNKIKDLLIEQQKQIVEQQKQIGNLIPKVGDTINNTHNIKQKFNINIFLNEQCKDAINMNDFIQQLQLTLNNLDTTKSKGLTDGLTNIFIENMNKLSLYQRPLHCTDIKRDTLYIKDNNNWEKDTDKTKIKNAIKDINKHHFKLISEWMEQNPDFKDNEEKQEYFAHLLRECGSNIEEISDKVIKKICTSTHIKDGIKDLNNVIID